MSVTEARALLSQWNGRLKDLALLRLPLDLCTTLAVHSSKVCGPFNYVTTKFQLVTTCN